MTPNSFQLTRAVLDGVLRAQALPGTVDIPSLLEGIRTAANELLLREDNAFFDDFIARGRTLIAEAAAHAGTMLLPPAQDRDSEIAGLLEAAAEATNVLARKGGDSQAMVTRLVDWERSLYDNRQRAAEGVAVDKAVAGITAERLEAYLRTQRKEWTDPRVVSFKMVPGGFSKITVLADVADGGGQPEGVALRIEPTRRMLDLDGMAIAAEYPLVRHAFEAGLPVAEPLFLETDTQHMGLQFMASRKVSGRTLGAYSGAAEPVEEAKLKDAIALIVKVQNLAMDESNPLVTGSYLKRWLDYSTLADSTLGAVEYWREAGRKGNAPASPLLERAYAWMVANVPQEDGRRVFNHGDFGFHNIMFDGDRISALLDWENGRIGDAGEELALFIMASASLASREQIVAWYDEAGGEPISEYRLRYWDVYHTYKVIISALVSLQRVQEDASGSLNLALFGLQYMAPMGAKLEEQIALAEQVRP